MAITKQLVIDKIEILEDGVIQVRRVLRVLDDDGTVIGERYQREAFVPTTPLPTVTSARVRAHAQLEWTPQVIAAYEAKLAASRTP